MQKTGITSFSSIFSYTYNPVFRSVIKAALLRPLYPLLSVEGSIEPCFCGRYGLLRAFCPSLLVGEDRKVSKVFPRDEPKGPEANRLAHSYFESYASMDRRFHEF